MAEEGTGVQNPSDTDDIMRIMWMGLGRRIGIIADVLGAIGFYGIVYEAVKLIATNNVLFGISVSVWTFCIGTAATGAVVFLAFKSAVQQSNGRIKTLEDLLEAALSGNIPRKLQKDMFDAAALIYGFEISKRIQFYTIYASGGDEDGKAKCQHEFHFRCHRRRLGIWWRKSSSSLAPSFSKTTDATVSCQGAVCQVEASREIIKSGGNLAVLENFKFYPAIGPRHGEVKLSFSDDLPPGTLLTKYPNTAGRDYDFISATPREPVRLLEIEAVFDGFKPSDVWADSVYGANGTQELKRESADLMDNLDWDERGAQHTAKLSIQYPVMGASYRLLWRLPEKEKTN
jgi:hypothetical protein